MEAKVVNEVYECLHVEYKIRPIESICTHEDVIATKVKPAVKELVAN